MSERNRVPFRLHAGSCIDVLRSYPSDYFDSCVCDPPYDLTSGKKGGSGVGSVNLDSPYGRARIGTGNGAGGFMGKAWDGTGIAFRPETWAEVLRVLKPGGFLLAFGGTRTWHRLVCAIEDAGFEIRDSIMWLYGSGFPKSLDVSKAIDAHLGHEREVTREAAEELRLTEGAFNCDARASVDRERRDKPVSAEATQWDGWGTALKPAWEPVCVARKGLAGTVAQTVLAHGTGGINIDGCRVAFGGELDEHATKNKNRHADFGNGARENAVYGAHTRERGADGNYDPPGRWPANVIHDGSDEVMAAFPQVGSVGHFPASQQPHRGSAFGDYRGAVAPERTMPKVSAGGAGRRVSTALSPTGMNRPGQVNVGVRDFGDDGSAARFFYVAKASQEDRNEGLEGFPLGNNMRVNAPRESEAAKFDTVGRNTHPTVKPTELMRYLCKLVTQPGGRVLDPFCGSGSTGKAAMHEGFKFTGIDLEQEHIDISRARIAHALWMAQNSNPFGL